MGVTATTAEEIFIGAGDVYVDDQPVGATMDNNVFRVVQEKGTPDLNGVPGPVLGLDYIESETAELEVTIPELGADKLAFSIPGAVSVVGDAVGVAAGGGASTTLSAPRPRSPSRARPRSRSATSSRSASPARANSAP
jgi:hypothetical protein